MNIKILKMNIKIAETILRIKIFQIHHNDETFWNICNDYDVIISCRTIEQMIQKLADNRDIIILNTIIYETNIEYIFN